jgi:hypothetical protein
MAVFGSTIAIMIATETAEDAAQRSPRNPATKRITTMTPMM